MPVLDLKPTSDETIQKLGLKPQNLWNVKINEEIYGPFESETLKHYAGENQDVFEGALASQLDCNEWMPFFSYPLFQRRVPQLIKGRIPQDAYFLLDQGKKIGPFTKEDLDKRIELGSIGLTELVSTDDGHTWQKLYHVEGFDRRFHTATELPFTPLDANFQKARLELIERIELHSGKVKASDEIAQLAFLTDMKGKIINFRPEDVSLPGPHQETMLSKNLKWQIPLGMAVMFVLTIGVRLMTPAPEEEMPQVTSAPKVRPKLKAVQKTIAVRPSLPPSKPVIPAPIVKAPTPPRPVYNREPTIIRAPASHRPSHRPPRPAVVNQEYAPEHSQYPTQIETHQNDYPYENDRITHEMDNEARDPASMEQSLIGRPPEDLQTLDAVMGNPLPSEMEEASDF